ncbi:alpha/beta hydrolase [Leeuwenhoekiella marinoflava]|uniref:Pimeloyl-ACP methyl ester carboxylesterase n=2 Tax=Leeuwenhoekiella marinoflava TaxID=988 RepID=A0A4Q0PMU2_9FLAO|nr:alpha/beta hydrolase [Leeuwenhoekiella marinoflava]RXG31839.1 pimeloyl-ACP methyl ester carboxylesterase [Leeuwenhoekiella marinoflava]SHF03175.1 Pimeloyl-ACP methyl ester carboxylesterase [Leeuwenhoekiella marinoflava DSM 3653]
MKIVKNLFLVLAMVFSLISCSDDDDNSSLEVNPSTLVLVHGAWQSAFVWDQVKTELEKQGNTVIAVELLGHGEDNTPVSDITFKGYVDQVKAVIVGLDTPVVLVGHSLGGAVITQTASEIPQQIEKLVYVAGFIPKNGKSVLDYSALDTESLLPTALEFSADGSTAAISNPEINIPEIFCQYGSDEDIDILVEKLKPEPVGALATPLDYKMDDYNAIAKKYYLFTKEDHAITYPFQQAMASEAGITNTFEITSGHSPFVSKPAELLQIFDTILTN